MLFKSSILAAAAACIAILSLAPTTEAHVGLVYPCVRNSDADNCKSGKVDYNYAAPIGEKKGVYKTTKDGLCKHKPTASNRRTTLKAGTTIKTRYEVTSAHKAGHCQWALSYDKGKTWVVFYDKLKTCLKTKKKDHQIETIPIKLPKDVPAGNAIFMWMWNNQEGNRELYTGCAEVKIESNSRQFTGVKPLVANFGSKSYFMAEDGLNDKKVLDKFNKREKITVKVKN